MCSPDLILMQLWFTFPNMGKLRRSGLIAARHIIYSYHKDDIMGHEFFIPHT